MMNSANEMMPMAPQMMGCCSFGIFGMFAGFVSMAKWPIAIAAILYLLAKRPQATIRPDEA